MSVELTSFERLTLPEDHPLKQLHRQEQQEAPVWKTDFCRAQTLGALCIECSVADKSNDHAVEAVSQAA